MRDERLVTAAAIGDPIAFAELVERHRPRVAVVLERIVGDEAEDLLQEALLRAYVGITSLRDPSRFGAWLCAIAVNLAKMRLRRRALEARSSNPEPERPSRDGSEERELLELVSNAVAVLPPAQRDAVLMHYVDGLSCDEVAVLLDTSPGAIRVRLHRARQQLREQLAPLAPKPRPQEEMKMLELKLEDVIVRVAEDDPMRLVSDHRIVLLRELAGERLLPIWIAAAEGNALALRLLGETTPRPVTSDVMAELVRVTGARVEHVAITELREETFYAVIALSTNGDVNELDVRPSDALNLAVRTGAAILVDENVLEQAAVGGGDLPAELAAKGSELAAKGYLAELELRPGVWRSLSAELLESLYRWR